MSMCTGHGIRGEALTLHHNNAHINVGFPGALLLRMVFYSIPQNRVSETTIGRTPVENIDSVAGTSTYVNMNAASQSHENTKFVEEHVRGAALGTHRFASHRREDPEMNFGSRTGTAGNTLCPFDGAVAFCMLATVRDEP